MNWNDAIQQLAETHWKPLGGICVPFQNVRRKPIAGYRFFSCEECGLNWNERTRDCESPSDEACPDCNELNHPNDSEQHPEWVVDKSGNLV